MKKATGKANGKIIIMGEHAVVHGYPSVALPFHAVEMTVTIEQIQTNAYLVSDLYEGPLHQAPSDLQNLLAVYDQLRANLMTQTQSHWLININSSIPAERGMGSSAAMATALVRAFYNYYELPLTEDQLLKYVDLSEKISHGNPSGLDARVAGLGVPFIYQKKQLMTIVHFDTPYWLVVADTGIHGNTKNAVSDVAAGLNSAFITRRQAVEHNLRQLGEAATRFIDLVELDSAKMANDQWFTAICRTFKDAHQHLRALQVSSPELEAGVTFAEANGAGAAKLTGGGRGGCYFALCDSKDKAALLAKALKEENMAVASWVVPFKSSPIDDNAGE